MGIHLQIELHRLNKMINEYVSYVEETLVNAINALLKRDYSAAEKIIEDDAILDQMEIDIEEECLKMLALYQPVANDLRFTVAILKLNNDLERVGDLAAHIARATLNLKDEKYDKPPIDIKTMMQKTKKLFRKSLASLVKEDASKAEDLLKKDESIDRLHKENYVKIAEYIRKNSDENSINVCLNFLSVSRYLERIADHATNIAEDVIYLVNGKIIRH